MDAYGSAWGIEPVGDGDGGGLCGELSTWHAPAQQRPRRAPRVPVDMSAGLRQRGASGVSVQVLDLSAHGFRAATHLQLPEGADVWLRLPGLEPYHAKVAWTEGHYIGCSFERPLHPAVVDMIARKGRG
jgi:hypothetical protein